MTQGLSSVCNSSPSVKYCLSIEHKEPYILIAVGIIVAIGGLVAAGYLHAYVGNYAFAIAGGGVGVGAIFILIAGIRRQKTTLVASPQKIEAVAQPTPHEHSKMIFFASKDKNQCHIWVEDLKAQGIQPMDSDELLTMESEWPDLPWFHFFPFSDRVPVPDLINGSEQYAYEKNSIWIVIEEINRGESLREEENQWRFNTDWGRLVHSGIGDEKILLTWSCYKDTHHLVDPQRYAQQLRDVSIKYSDKKANPTPPAIEAPVPVIEVAPTTVVVAPEKVEVVAQPVQYDRSAMIFFKITGKRLIGHSSIPECWEEDLKEQGIQPIDGNQLVATGGDDDPLPDLPFFHFFSYSERVPLERLVPESEEYFDMTNRRCVWILLKKVYQGEPIGIIENSTTYFYHKRHGWERVQSGFGDVRKLLWWCYYHETGRLIDPARYAQQLRDVAEQYYKTDIS